MVTVKISYDVNLCGAIQFEYVAVISVYGVFGGLSNVSLKSFPAIKSNGISVILIGVYVGVERLLRSHGVSGSARSSPSVPVD